MTISMNLLIVLSVSLISSLILVMQVQRDFAGDALCFHALSLLFLFFPFRATQAYCNPPDKAITKTNNLSAKAGLDKRHNQ